MHAVGQPNGQKVPCFLRPPLGSPQTSPLLWSPFLQPLPLLIHFPEAKWQLWQSCSQEQAEVHHLLQATRLIIFKCFSSHPSSPQPRANTQSTEQAVNCFAGTLLFGANESGKEASQEFTWPCSPSSYFCQIPSLRSFFSQWTSMKLVQICLVHSSGFYLCCIAKIPPCISGMWQEGISFLREISSIAGSDGAPSPGAPLHPLPCPSPLMVRMGCHSSVPHPCSCPTWRPDEGNENHQQPPCSPPALHWGGLDRAKSWECWGILLGLYFLICVAKPQTRNQCFEPKPFQLFFLFSFFALFLFFLHDVIIAYIWISFRAKMVSFHQEKPKTTISKMLK